ncbi:PilW family protein [Massilia sp. S19_KUP03_FR1]|uniref:PilW family protein n=1 Tax=Massilia sp. S19_KUP03_FR1 TaxID=3025503 RepID=UPI002FCCF59B
MKRHRTRQRGLTIPELLIALTIGALITLAGASLLGIANTSYATQLDAAAVDDGGRYALDLVARAVRQAGLRDWDGFDPAAGIDPLAPPRILGLDARSIAKTGYGIDNPLPDAANGSDVLALRYQGAGPAPDGDGSALNCAGFPVHANEDGWSIFYVANNAQGEAELRCKYRGASSWAADAVVAGVDTFQVLYAVDTDTPADGVANVYLNASGVSALDAVYAPGPALQEHTHWKRVLAVRIALLLHGARPSYLSRETQVFDLFGAPYSDARAGMDAGTRLPEDQLAPGLRLRERHQFVTTVRLR